MQPKRDRQFLVDFIGNMPVPDTSFMMFSSCGRLGAVLSNVSVFLLLLGIALFLATLLSGVVTGLFVIILMLLVILAIIFTLGLILLAIPEELEQLLSFNETLGSITVWFGNAAARVSPYALCLAAVFAAISVILLSIDKTKKHMPRIVLSVFIVIIAAACTTIAFVSGGGL